jgi:hypothetical protein
MAWSELLFERSALSFLGVLLASLCPGIEGGPDALADALHAGLAGIG